MTQGRDCPEPNVEVPATWRDFAPEGAVEIRPVKRLPKKNMAVHPKTSESVAPELAQRSRREMAQANLGGPHAPGKPGRLAMALGAHKPQVLLQMARHFRPRMRTWLWQRSLEGLRTVTASTVLVCQHEAQRPQATEIRPDPVPGGHGREIRRFSW